ncbi:MAG: hypothetical protein ACTSU5_19400 [Promethearchaeota archaeon]
MESHQPHLLEKVDPTLHQVADQGRPRQVEGDSGRPPRGGQAGSGTPGDWRLTFGFFLVLGLTMFAFAFTTGAFWFEFPKVVAWITSVVWYGVYLLRLDA